MQDLQQILQRMREKKKEKRNLAAALRDALAHSKQYQDILEQLKTLKAKKLQYERSAHEEFRKELEQSERLKEDLKSDAQVLSDMALTKYIKGESIQVKDENDVTYDPVFKVTFKKSNTV